MVELTKVMINDNRNMIGYIVPDKCPDWNLTTTKARTDIHLYRPDAETCYSRHIPIFTDDKIKVVTVESVVL